MHDLPMEDVEHSQGIMPWEQSLAIPIANA